MAASQVRPEIQCELVDLIATVTLSNPSRRNALPQSLWKAIPGTLETAISGGARVLVLKGAGEDFCAGADISEFDSVRRDDETARVYETANAEAFQALRECQIPTISSIRGFCLGGGFGLAAACDIRVASSNAKFAVPAAKLGLAYPVTAMADIVHAVGQQMAKRMLFSAQRFCAKDMLRAGFLSEIVEDGELDDTVASLAETIAGLAPLTHRATKASIAAALGGDADGAERAGAATFASADYAEGRSAFREKRKPNFQGR